MTTTFELGDRHPLIARPVAVAGDLGGLRNPGGSPAEVYVVAWETNAGRVTTIELHLPSRSDGGVIDLSADEARALGEALTAAAHDTDLLTPA